MEHTPTDSVVIVCQGDPLCELEGDAAVARQLKGCPLCKRIYIDAYSGKEREFDPVRNPN